MKENLKDNLLKKTVALIEQIAYKSSEGPSKFGFFEIPIPKELKDRKRDHCSM